MGLSNPTSWVLCQILQLQPPIAPVFKHNLQLRKIVIFVTDLSLLLLWFTVRRQVDDSNTVASQMCMGWSQLEHFNAEFESVFPP